MVTAIFAIFVHFCPLWICVNKLLVLRIGHLVYICIERIKVDLMHTIAAPHLKFARKDRHHFCPILSNNLLEPVYFRIHCDLATLKHKDKIPSVELGIIDLAVLWGLDVPVLWNMVV